MTTTFSHAELEAEGFRGWVPLATLDTARVPNEPGVYLVYRVTPSGPAQYLATSAAGRFKKRDPSVDESVLRSKWVTGASTLYIGKGTNLRRRLRQYKQFGAGHPVGHWGGRYVWQLADHPALLAAWQPSFSPETAEAELLRRFMEAYGRLPFANIAMPSGAAEWRVSHSAPPTRAGSTAPDTPGRRHFSIAGRSVSLTQREVEAAMNDVVAESVQKHAVRIGGQLFPVVQVLECATSVPRAETRSARARAVLQQLGFTLVCRRP